MFMLFMAKRLEIDVKVLSQFLSLPWIFISWLQNADGIKLLYKVHFWRVLTKKLMIGLICSTKLLDVGRGQSGRGSVHLNNFLSSQHCFSGFSRSCGAQCLLGLVSLSGKLFLCCLTFSQNWAWRTRITWCALGMVMNGRAFGLSHDAFWSYKCPGRFSPSISMMYSRIYSTILLCISMILIFSFVKSYEDRVIHVWLVLETIGKLTEKCQFHVSTVFPGFCDWEGANTTCPAKSESSHWLASSH